MRVSARKGHEEAMAWVRIFDDVLPTAKLYVTQVSISYLFFYDFSIFGRVGKENDSKKHAPVVQQQKTLECTTVMHFSLVERTESYCKYAFDTIKSMILVIRKNV